MSRSSTLAILCITALAGTALAFPTPGPDVIVGDLHDVLAYGQTGGISAFSVGTVSCNIGNQRLSWISGNNQHPVIGTNMFRYKVVNGAGRFEQIGQSWLKHGFYALSGSLCSPCGDPTDGTQLGVGCSDPYSASLNGSQSNLGPRSQVNASTGYYPFPVTGVTSPAAIIGRRLQVRNTDLAAAENAGATYFVEGQYVSADECAYGAGAQFNNASFRRVNVSFASNQYNIALNSTTQRQKAAIFAWRDVIDSTVNIQEQDVRSDGRFIIAHKVTQVAPNRWTYEYALQNLNSDRGAGSFTVNFPCSALQQDVGFNASFSHSGEPYDNSPWAANFSTPGQVTWATAQNFTQNPNANALRWGTMNNFRFTTNRPPRNGTATIGLFKPGSGATISFGVQVPRSMSDFNADNITDFFDYLDFVQAFSDSSMTADTDGDGTLDFFDYLDFVTAFSAGC
ncbi:MAG: hypothetical protein KGS45_05000 [Planctomycetes bacterium]|nr:hypothetical protein [Planctomycetota bacterium]